MQTTQKLAAEIVHVQGPLSEQLEGELLYLKSQIAQLHQAYQQAAKLYIDRIVYIESLRPNKTYVMATQEPNHGS